MQKQDVNNAAYVLGYGLEQYPDSPLFLSKKGLFIAGVSPSRVDEIEKSFKIAKEQLPNYQPIKDDYNLIVR